MTSHTLQIGEICKCILYNYAGNLYCINDKKKRQAEVEAAQQRIFEVEERHRIAVERETKYGL